MICTNLHCTAEGFDMRVSSHVSFKVIVGVERLLADGTLFCLFPIVQLQMLLQKVGLEELEVALWTFHIDLQCGVLGHFGNNCVLARSWLILCGTLGTSQLLLFGLQDNFTPLSQFAASASFSFSTSWSISSNFWSPCGKIYTKQEVLFLLRCFRFAFQTGAGGVLDQHNDTI